MHIYSVLFVALSRKQHRKKRNYVNDKFCLQNFSNRCKQQYINQLVLVYWLVFIYWVDSHVLYIYTFTFISFRLFGFVSKENGKSNKKLTRSLERV